MASDESDRNELPANQISDRLDRVLRRMIEMRPQPKKAKPKAEPQRKPAHVKKAPSRPP
ncbi:MAG TPA: hypothetical protein VMB34_20240 [Acetobacteraceae bacterium]|nr:hypothetical protein [Acetobacteraceae bacterium]